MNMHVKDSGKSLGDILAAALAKRDAKLKVGDRVRIVTKPDNGSFGEVGDVGTITSVGSDDVFLSFETGRRSGESWYVDVKAIEPISPFHIEAGKYYRTRDGRKVGPMEEWQYGGWHAPKADRPLNGGVWEDDGSPRYDGAKESPRLISEWPADPVGGYHSCAAAEVDNLRDEYGWAAREDKPKFKVGDRVEIVSAASYVDKERYLGATFTIDSDEGNFDGEQSWSGKDNPSPYRYKESELRLVAPATSGKSPAIVARIDNGQPRPSSNPFVHPDRASAEKEAARLASANPGKEFGVYEFVSSAKEERRYEHEWQRYAAEGSKHYATNSLMCLSGLDRKQAKDAVEGWIYANL